MRRYVEGATWPFTVLTSAFCPDFDPEKLLMAICIGYFERDESSRSQFSVTGLLSPKARWRQFEPLWTQALRHDDLAAFNARDFASAARDFTDGWDEARRLRLIDTLARIAEQHVLRAFTVSVRLDDFEAVNAEYAFAESAAGLYGVCAGTLMANARRWLAARHPDDLVLFVFEEGNVDAREMTRIACAEAPARGEPPQIWPRAWTDELGRPRRLRPFEACDLLTVGDTAALKARLVQRSRLQHDVVDRPRLLRLAQALCVPPRGATTAAVVASTATTIAESGTAY